MNTDGSAADPAQIASAMRKMQEDPLFAIKKKEAEHHKSLIDNPLIRERVRQMVKAERERDTRGNMSTSNSIYSRKARSPQQHRSRSRSVSRNRDRYSSRGYDNRETRSRHHHFNERRERDDRPRERADQFRSHRHNEGRSRSPPRRR
jgi:hypothetical protein